MKDFFKCQLAKKRLFLQTHTTLVEHSSLDIEKEFFHSTVEKCSEELIKILKQQSALVEFVINEWLERIWWMPKSRNVNWSIQNIQPCQLLKAVHVRLISILILSKNPKLSSIKSLRKKNDANQLDNNQSLKCDSLSINSEYKNENGK